MTTVTYDATTTAHANLLDLAPVAAGGIVSKPLLDHGDVKQILFAMDTNQAISEHQVPYPATVQILDGKLHFTVAHEVHEMESGDWLIMPPHAPHALRAEKPTRFLLTLLKGPST